jgi:hypothetical protein
MRWQERVRRRDGGDFTYGRTAYAVGPSRQSAAIVIRQMQATIPKLSTQESIFVDQVRDGLSLPPSQPANEHAQHYLQRDGVDHGIELISRRRPKDVGQAPGHCGRRTATVSRSAGGKFGGLRRIHNI